jgi:hypothetical protein
MASQSDALRIMLTAIAAMHEAGYTKDDIQEFTGETWDHIEAGADGPYAFGHCTNCNRIIIGWSAYQWGILVREPCPRCGKPW